MCWYISQLTWCAHFCVKSFWKFNTIIPARASKVEIIYSFIEFQIFMSYIGTLLTSCRYICLKFPLPPLPLSNSWLRDFTQVLKELCKPSVETQEQCLFSLYVSQRLSAFDRKTRMIAEKRISDILFELEMNSHTYI